MMRRATSSGLPAIWVGRGPKPLSVLQRIRQMQHDNPRLVVVLGNHDLHLIALALGAFVGTPRQGQDIRAGPWHRCGTL